MFNVSANAIDQWDKVLENAEAEMKTGCLSFETFILLQRLWSARTFGPLSHRGPLGPLKHLKKEVDEAVEAFTSVGCPHNRLVEEYADLFFLVVDAVWRSGISPVEFRQALTAKLDKNRRRTWPDWTTKDANDAIEHDRSGE